jgi:lysophospholipase
MNHKKPFLLVLLFWLLSGISAMTNATDEVSQRALTTEKSIAIEHFWTSVQQATFSTEDNISIAYATNFKRPEKPYIVIVPGRSESYLKYQELVFDLDNEGYDSVVIDHRGQGLSGRLTKNRFQGYVKQFDDYAQDLQQLLNQELPRQYPSHKHGAFMLAHSMGGAIALRYLQRYPNNIKALSLSSPMIAISSGGIPLWLARSIIKTAASLNKWLSDSPWYFFGQNDINQSSFADNRLMHSAKRFQRFQALYNQRSELKLGGVTFYWLEQAIDASKNLFNDIDKLSLPIQMLQAEEDHIVDNAVQNEFCLQLNKRNANACLNGKVVVISGAYHELLFEKDIYRDIALDNILTWFSQHQ